MQSVMNGIRMCLFGGIVLVALSWVSACEEEGSSMPPPPPPGPPPGAEPAPAPETASSPSPSNVAEKSDQAASEEEPVTDARKLPFMQRLQRAAGPNPMFEGKPVKASAKYRRLRVRRRPVSPLRWKLNVSSDAETSVAENVSWQESDDEDAAEAPAFQVKLYRRNASTGEVEVFEQSYASEQEYAVALTRKLSDGYSRTPPAAPTTPKGKSQAAASDKPTVDEGGKKTKKPAKGAEAKAKKGKSCPVEVTWTTGQGDARKEHSRCFKDRKAAKVFQDKRRQGLGSRGRPVGKAKKGKAPARNDRSLQPVKP